MLEDADVEQQTAGVHLQVDIPALWRVGGFVFDGGEGAAELFENRGLGGVAVLLGALDVDGIGEEQLCGAVAGGFVERTGAVIDLGEEAFGVVEVGGDVLVLRVGRERAGLKGRGRGRGRQDAGFVRQVEHHQSEQAGCEGGGGGPEKRPAAGLQVCGFFGQKRQSAAQALPGVIEVGLGDRAGGEDAQGLGDRLGRGCAESAVLEVRGHERGVGGLAELVGDQLVFRKVTGHRTPPTAGRSERRSLPTARKTACLTELVGTRRASAISARGTSSMWRRVKAVRSMGVSVLMAASRREAASASSSRRSGPAPKSASFWRGSIPSAPAPACARCVASRWRRSMRLMAVFMAILLTQVEKLASWRKVESRV